MLSDTIADYVRARAEDPLPGLVDLGAGGRTWTWAELVAAATGQAAWMTPGQHIGVLMENSAEYVTLLFGAALAGAVIVGINPTRRGAELERDIRHTDCSVVLTDDAHRGLLEGLSLPPVTASPPDDDLYLLLFTSGSTGAPKAVRMTQQRAARTAAPSSRAFRSEDVLYCAMPLFHGNALLTNLFPALIAGARVVLRPRFSASAFLPDVRQHHCTFFNYVGRSLSYIVATPPTEHDRDNDLKWALGSEASPRDIVTFTERFGCPIYEGYGSSENAIVIQPGPGMPPNAMGKPRADLDVAILDPSTGEEKPAAVFGPSGELLNDPIGEIVGRNSAPAFEGYYNNPDAEAERLRNGWYWSGDLGYRDAEGWFYFAGRSADWLRVDGENFSTAPVERILSRFFPGGVAVYAVPDAVTGDQVMVAVEGSTGGFDGGAFAAFLGEQPDLGTKWAPRYVRVVSALPSTATGKLDKQPLRRWRWEPPDVWVRDGATYRPMTDADRVALEDRFREHGRADQIMSR